MQALHGTQVIAAHGGDFLGRGGRLLGLAALFGLGFRRRGGHDLHALADGVFMVEQLGDHGVQLGEGKSLLGSFPFPGKVVVGLLQQRPSVPGLPGQLVDILHTLADGFGHFFFFKVQQGQIGGLHLSDKLR